jgi:DinB superfamily
MADIGSSLRTAFDYVWDRFSDRLAGMGDDEYLWAPAAGCWSVRLDAEGRGRLDGGGGGGPAPDPAPLTTIAWRIGHVGGLALGGFANRLFEDGSLRVEDIDFPGHVADAIPFLERNYGRWRSGVASLDSDQWWMPLGPAWGPYAESTTVDLALHVLDELVHHGAEVGLLRDLYANRTA